MEGNATNVYGGGAPHYEGKHHRPGEYCFDLGPAIEKGTNRHLLIDPPNRNHEGAAPFTLEVKGSDTEKGRTTECLKATHNK